MQNRVYHTVPGLQHTMVDICSEEEDCDIICWFVSC